MAALPELCRIAWLVDQESVVAGIVAVGCGDGGAGWVAATARRAL